MKRCKYCNGSELYNTGSLVCKGCRSKIRKGIEVENFEEIDCFFNFGYKERIKDFINKEIIPELCAMRNL